MQLVGPAINPNWYQGGITKLTFLRSWFMIGLVSQDTGGRSVPSASWLIMNAAMMHDPVSSSLRNS